MFQPFEVAARAREGFRRYIRTGFPLRDPDLEAGRERLIEEGLLWAEPYISLARPGSTGPELSSLEGLLLPETIALPWGFDRLYGHQAEAIERLAPARAGGPRSTLVLSGTGSGKTEAFLIPVVDACFRSPGPGVKAVVIYPMNALANDQLRRLREVLGGTGITFGRYTGDAPEFDEGDGRRPGRPADAPENLLWSRRAMRDTPPNILLTNYTQLEYILLRRKDAELFRYGPPLYLIVDEIHLFTGILGAEVAALLRRFGQHVGAKPSEIVAVGTSATAGSEQERERLLGFAGAFFGVRFDPEAAISETPEPLRDVGPEVPPPPELTREMLTAPGTEGLRELSRRVFGVEVVGEGEEFGSSLGEVIDRFATVGVVERALARPAPLIRAAEALAELPERRGVPLEALLLEVEAILLLGAAARQPAIGEREPVPRFRPRLHQFVRSLVGLSRCLDPACGTVDGPGRSTCRVCGRLSLPLASCRTCGEAYWAGPIEKEDLATVTRLAALEGGREQPHVYLATEDQLADRVDQDEEGNAIVWEPIRACPACGAAAVGERPLDHSASCPSPVLTATYLASTDRVHCPRCGDQGARNRPILLPMRGSAAASVAVLTQVLSDELRRQGGEAAGRLLVFGDSRQDAGQQAGYADDQGARIAVRQIVMHVLSDTGMALSELTRAVAGHVLGDEATLRRWLVGESDQDFAERSAPHYQPSQADEEGIQRQLEWEVTLEVTERARRRFSLEREGLLVVGIDRLPELAAQVEAAWPDHPFGSTQRLGQVILAVCDVMRYGRAVDQWMLQRKPRELRRTFGIRIGDRAIRATRGYGERRFVSGKDQVDIRAWVHEKYATRMGDLVGRVLGKGPTDPTTVAAVEGLVSRMGAVGLLVPRKADARVRHMVDHKRVVLRRRTDEPIFRCRRCGLVRSAELTNLRGQPICVNWRCRGLTEPFAPDPDRDFYVRQYLSPPRRLIVREHSGQVESEERVVLEQRFNDRKHPTVDVLACTPTLEIGVSLDDLNAVILRNLPPGPANYAQRVGRAGRRSMVALAIGHAGQGPHDTYFFERPAEMISGAVRAPAISLDNQPLLRRHVNSLILETLGIDLPGRWVPPLEAGEEFDEPTVADPDGVIRESTLKPFEDALSDPATRARVLEAVQNAFTSPDDPARPQDVVSLCESQVERFPSELRAALNRWCHRYKALLDELEGIRRTRGVRTQEEKAAEDRLEAELLRMANPSSPEQLPLGFLGIVGFLPRYGFTGDSVLLYPSRSEEPITQSAQVAVTDFAPGNIVYARGRKLRIRRLDPPPVDESEAGAELRDNVVRKAWRCDDCEFLTFDPLTKSCPMCREDLVGQTTIRLTGVRGGGAPISSEDEYRDRASYDVIHSLGEPLTQPEIAHIGGLEVRLSLGREISIVNRGLAKPSGERADGFSVCTFCGFAGETAVSEEEEDEPEENRGHTLRCPGRSDRNADVIRHNAWLTAHIRGDVLELLLPPAARTPAFERWRRTLGEALILGIRETMQAGRRDLDVFERRRGGVPEAVVLFDTMPGGTGYLRKLLAGDGEGLRAAVWAALGRLETCTCDDSCHRCLRDFWNQRYHGQLNRHEVLATLRRLAGGSVTEAQPPEDDRLESFLELEFFGRLKAAGLPEPTLQVVRARENGRIIRVDAEYRDPDISIFLDGREYHAASREKIEDDLRKRNELEARGVLVLEFTYRDVMDRFEDVATLIKQARDAGVPTPAGPPYLGPGLALGSVDERRGLVRVTVDPEAWAKEEAARQQSLSSANVLRLQGWRLERSVV